MKPITKSLLLITILSSFCTTILCGCQSQQTIGKTPNDEMNPALNTSQRDIINQHKNRDVR